MERATDANAGDRYAAIRIWIIDQTMTTASPTSASSHPNASPWWTGTDTITDVAGIEVGQFTDDRRPTGCSVVLARTGAVGGVDVRGAAPGTRETDLLHPSNLVDTVHAILLAGGSAWGLDAAGGVMRWLEENGIGLPVVYGLVPIVRVSDPMPRQVIKPASKRAQSHPQQEMSARVLAHWSASCSALPEP